MSAVDAKKGLRVGTAHVNEKAATSFIHSIARAIRDKIRDEVERSPFRSFIMDGASDVTGRELVCLLAYIKFLL